MRVRGAIVCVGVVGALAGGVYAQDPFDMRAELTEEQIASVERRLMERYDIREVRPATRDSATWPETHRKAWDRVILSEPGEGGAAHTVPHGVWVTLSTDSPEQAPRLYQLGGDPLGGDPVLTQAPETVVFSEGPGVVPSAARVEEPDPESFERP